MFDSTLDLFCHNEILDDRQHMIDLMRDVYWEGMNLGVNEDRHADAIACFEEWIVDGDDPQDGEREFTFIADLTRLIEDQ